MKQKDHWIVYPEYFERHRPRSKGRRLAKTLAKDKVSLEDLKKACEKLGFEYVLEKDKKYPANWYFSKGRILIKKIPNKTKADIIKEIARCLR